MKLGILTNGAHWRFFTDAVNSNIMDKEPFATWDASSDASPVPVEVLTLLQKAKFSSDHIRTFALRQRTESLLVTELSRLLEPSPEFVKLALQNIESRNLTPAVVENWKPILNGAIQQWAKQRSLAEALETPSSLDVSESAAGKIVTTQQELDAFAQGQRILI